MKDWSWQSETAAELTKKQMLDQKIAKQDKNEKKIPGTFKYETKTTAGGITWLCKGYLRWENKTTINDSLDQVY